MSSQLTIILVKHEFIFPSFCVLTHILYLPRSFNSPRAISYRDLAKS